MPRFIVTGDDKKTGIEQSVTIESAIDEADARRQASERFNLAVLRVDGCPETTPRKMPRIESLAGREREATRTKWYHSQFEAITTVAVGTFLGISAFCILACIGLVLLYTVATGGSSRGGGPVSNAATALQNLGMRRVNVGAEFSPGLTFVDAEGVHDCPGWTQVIVRAENKTGQTIEGRISATFGDRNGNAIFTTDDRPFSFAAGQSSPSYVFAVPELVQGRIDSILYVSWKPD